MDDRVSKMIRIIDHTGDSFSQRSEMYYQKRPELLSLVEQSLRAYRSIAERYDYISRELQSANRTIAKIFPEQVQLSIDEEEEEERILEASALHKPNKLSQALEDSRKENIPEVPNVPMKNLMSQPMDISKTQNKKVARPAKPSKPSSGLSKDEALEEIDNLQKKILVLQTEKEFVKCLYEHNIERYWEIENQISEMQNEISGLQDEFSVGTVIEDGEARMLMATTAIKSCQAALDKLQARHEESVEEARVENQRLEETGEKFQTLKREYLTDQMDSGI